MQPLQPVYYFNATPSSGGAVQRQFGGERRWGVAPFLYGPGGDNLTHLWTDAWVMPKDAPHPRAAFEFMLFINTGSRVQDFAQTVGFFPTLKSLDKVTLAQDAKATGMAMTVDQLRSAILGSLVTGRAFEAPGHTVDSFVRLNTIWTNTTDRLFLGTQPTVAAIGALRRGFEAVGVGLG
ncbi:MAG: extracellular solute-binding protein [Chloroflexi bacterium]|nr:extracellular solute-binding protein [Chloroflexota bacterium]